MNIPSTIWPFNCPLYGQIWNSYAEGIDAISNTDKLGYVQSKLALKGAQCHSVGRLSHIQTAFVHDKNLGRESRVYH